MSIGLIIFLGSLIYGEGGTVIGMSKDFDHIVTTNEPVPEGRIKDRTQKNFKRSIQATPFSILGIGLLIGGGIAHFKGKKKNKETV